MGNDFVSKAFASARQTLSWAKEGIQEHDAECRAFFKRNPFKSVVYIDEDAGQEIHKVVLVKGLPPIIAKRATEALAHIRNSFDQATYAGLTAIRKTPKKSVYFPWADSPIDLEYRLGAVSKKSTPPDPKITPELWPAFRSLEPYPRGNGYTGGDDLVRKLAEIANRKHTLNLTFTPATLGGILPGFVGTMHGGSGGFRVPKLKWDTVKNELILAIVPTGFKLAHGTKLVFNIAFNESVPLRDVVVADALAHFAAKAERTIQVLEKEARQIVGA